MERLGVKVVALAAVLVLVSLPVSESVISCSDVLKDLSPCLSYLVSGSGMPPPACCAGATALSRSTASPEDKRAACACLKSASQQIKPNQQLAQALPGNCGISLPVAVSPDVDCSKVS